MANTVIRAGIAYTFYAMPYSMPTIKKLDKKIFALQKKICGLPICTPNVVTQLPHDLFGLEAFSIKNAYLTCIGEQLRNALNDKGRLGKIYIGLTNYILAKHVSALKLSRIKQQDCIRSPTTRTLFLLKKVAYIHIESSLPNFSLLPTPLETIWMLASMQQPQITQQRSLQLLNKLLIHHITDLAHITLPNGTHLMSIANFKTYHTTPTKLIQLALQLAAQLFCHPSCFLYCPNHCQNHHPPRILLPQFILQNHHIIPNNPQPLIQQPIPLHPNHPLPPKYILNKPLQFPIHIILNHKDKKHLDSHQVIKKYTTYLCQWKLPNGNFYHKWLPQNKIIPWSAHPTIINHNLILLTQYYTTSQNQYYQISFNCLLKLNVQKTLDISYHHQSYL
jgi:hypothetical protein